MKRKLIKFIIFFSIILLIFFIWIVYSTMPNSVNCNFDDGKELAKKYHSMHLKQFTCNDIELQNNNELIVINFSLKSSNHRKFSFIKYSPDSCVKDIIEVRNVTKDFLLKNPENEMNNKKIKFIFHLYADESMYMYNYDYNSGSKEKNSYEFLYFKSIELDNVSVLSPLYDAKKISFHGGEDIYIDELKFFENFKNLKQLSCPRFYTSELLNYLKKILPDCEIVN